MSRSRQSATPTESIPPSPPNLGPTVPLPPELACLVPDAAKPPRRLEPAPIEIKPTTIKQVRAAARDFIVREFARGRQYPGVSLDPILPSLVRSLEYGRRVDIQVAEFEDKKRRLDQGTPTEIPGTARADLTKLSEPELLQMRALLAKVEGAP